MLIRFFGWFLNMSISAALVSAAILLVRRIFSKRLPVYFAYLLWGIVLFRFAVPISFPALFSALGITGRRSYPVGPDGMAAVVMYLEPGEMPLTSPDGYGEILWQAFAWVWLAGVVLLLVYGALGWRSIRRKADLAFVVRDDDLLKQCSSRAGLYRTPPLYRSAEFPSPVIVGLVRPRIILPELPNMQDESRLRHILIHECVHLRRLDHITKFLFSLVLCLHWFNPLAWVSCMLFDRDVEASCDERSLALLGETNKAGYARSLIDLSSVQQSVLLRRIAFSESSLHRRVMNIVRYRPLVGYRKVLVICLVLFIGLMTVTNPLHTPNIYIPKTHPVSAQSNRQMDNMAAALAQTLSEGNSSDLLALSYRSDQYYLPLYTWLNETPLRVKSYKLYPQTETLAYCYMIMENGQQYVAVIDREFITLLQAKAEFEAYQLLDRTDEAFRFIENLHRFGILQQIESPDQIPRSAAAMLCIDEVYRDKLAAEEIEPDQIYLEPGDIAQAASDYLGLQDFSYTFDPDLYDESRQSYIYAPDRGGRYDVQVVSLEHGEMHTTITAIVYSDPLRMMPESVITYTLQKRDGDPI